MIYVTFNIPAEMKNAIWLSQYRSLFKTMVSKALGEPLVTLNFQEAEHTFEVVVTGYDSVAENNSASRCAHYWAWETYTNLSKMFEKADEAGAKRILKNN